MSKKYFYVMKEEARKQMEIVSGDSREAIMELIHSNSRLCREAQVAVVEKQDQGLFKALMSSQRRICDKAIVKIFMLNDVIWVKLFGRYCRTISQKAHETLCKKCTNYAERYVEYDKQRYCEEFVEDISRNVDANFAFSLEAIFGEANDGYSIQRFVS